MEGEAVNASAFTLKLHTADAEMQPRHNLDNVIFAAHFVLLLGLPCFFGCNAQNFSECNIRRLTVQEPSGNEME